MKKESPYRHADEASIIEGLVHGDPDAFTYVMERYRNRVYSVAIKLLKSRELAEEVVQEIFLKLWTHRVNLKGVKNLEAYLFTMSRNLVISHLKKIMLEQQARNEMALNPNVTDNDPDDEDHLNQYHDALHAAINRLPPQQQLIFRMAKLEGLSYEAIAHKLNISRFTVKNHMAEALKSLRLSAQSV